MAIPWRVPPNLWQGQTVVVMASGPSLLPSVVEAVHQSGAIALVTNNTHKLAPWARMLIANDASWWDVHRDEAMQFPGLKYSASDPPIDGVLTQRITGAEGYDPDPDCLRTGGNSGYTAVHIAAQAGASRVLLCGFDMRGGHWHPDHAKPLRTTPPSSYERWIARFATLAPELERIGVEVINCTERSALGCFSRAKLEDVL
jgi:hypothetical protein